MLLKELHPIETAEFQVSQGICNEPAFNWWVPHILRKREAMRYLKKMHRFGIELPKLVAHALELDQCNGNTLWADPIVKEMKKDMRPAFKILDPGDADPTNFNVSGAT